MLQTLSRRSTARTQKLANALQETGIVNLFNPSIQITADGYAVAFRGLKAGAKKPFDAFLSRFGEDFAPLGSTLSLSELFKPSIGANVCDPKLFQIDGRCWITFNTGHFERPNRVFVASVDPDIGPPIEIIYSDRTEIEKNWAFFEHDGKLHALYSTFPTIVLREKTRLDGSITLERVKSTTSGTDEFVSKAIIQPKVTIGTQLEPLNPSKNLYGFIGHRRWYWRGKRLYLGCPMTLTMDEQNAHIQTSRDIWAHSLRSLMGANVKHNPNLISCTYFSGVSMSADKAIVSYGINDVDFSLAEVPLTWWSKLLA